MEILIINIINKARNKIKSILNANLAIYRNKNQNQENNNSSLKNHNYNNNNNKNNRNIRPKYPNYNKENLYYSKKNYFETNLKKQKE